MIYVSLPYFRTGLVIAILNMLAILNSSYFFLITARFPVPAWLVFNACVPSVVLFIAGFFTKSRIIMAASLPFLLFFGGGGLFVFTWKGYSAIAHVGHILMVIASIYIIAVIITESNWKAGIYGFIAGLILIALILPFQQKYVKNHPEYSEKAGMSE